MPRVVRPLIRALYMAGVAGAEAWPLVLKTLWIEPVLRSVCEEVGPGLRAERLPYMRGRGTIRIGRRVHLSGRSCFYFMDVVGERPRIEIGDGAFIGNGCTFSAARLISIGAGCLISTMVRVHDNDGHPLDSARRRAGERITSEEIAPVVLEENVWVGAGAIILKGVRVGRDAVIGAGAVVTRDVPAGAVAAGNPAVVVRG